MTKVSRCLTILMASCGLAVVATPAQAVNTTYEFTGNCLDCSASAATGLLTLSDYTLGDALSLSNLVSFTYSSSNYPSISFDTFTSVFGSITGDGANNLAFRGTSGGANYYFGTALTGTFAFLIDTPQDIGNAGSWTLQQAATAVPEPAAWALMILGFGVAGTAMRRRKVVAVAA